MFLLLTAAHQDTFTSPNHFKARFFPNRVPDRAGNEVHISSESYEAHRGTRSSVSHKMAAIHQAERGGVSEGRRDGCLESRRPGCVPNPQAGREDAYGNPYAKESGWKNERRLRGSGARMVKIHTFSACCKASLWLQNQRFNQTVLRRNKNRS